MILAILQARMSSSRLPGKVMKPILGRPMIGMHIERLLRAQRIVRLVLATSAEPSDNPLAAYCAAQNVNCYRGSLLDSLSRFQGALQTFGPADHIVRLTGDCPLADWTVIDACIDLHLAKRADFTSNAIQRTFPIGLDVEVMTAELLDRLSALSTTTSQREHVTQLVYDRPEAFKCEHLVQALDESRRRWTVDTAADFAMVKAVYSALYPGKPNFSTQDIRALLASRPDIAALNGA